MVFVLELRDFFRIFANGMFRCRLNSREEGIHLIRYKYYFLLMGTFFFWMVAAAVLAIVEVLTLWIWSICVAAGAVVAGIVSLSGCSFPVQLITLALGSLIFFLVFGRMLQRWHERRASRHKGYFATNMDELMGRRTVVTEATTPRAPARVRIDGDNWQVRTSDSRPLSEGEEIEITGYDSIVLICRPVGSK